MQIQKQRMMQIREMNKIIRMNSDSKNEDNEPKGSKTER